MHVGERMRTWSGRKPDCTDRIHIASHTCHVFFSHVFQGILHFQAFLTIITFFVLFQFHCMNVLYMLFQDPGVQKCHAAFVAYVFFNGNRGFFSCVWQEMPGF